MKKDHFGVRTLLHILAFTAILAFSANAQTTVFTYQGKLNDGLAPANGTYEIQFSLFNAAADGMQIGPTITDDSVTVIQGVFTVQLDFAVPGAFDGGPRWLEIAVKKPVEPAFTMLSPRQPVTSAPYAVKALMSDAAAIASDSDQLGGVNANEYVQTDNPALTDARDPLPGSASYVQNTTATQPLSNFNISGEGKADIFSAAAHYRIGADRVLIADSNENTFTGVGAGEANTGTANSFFGSEAGLSNTTGAGNAFFGFQSGSANTLGVSNAYFGTGSGRFGSGGNDNSFFGSGSGSKNTAHANSFFGSGSGAESVSGINNAFFGADAGRNNFDGDANVFLGKSAGLNNLNGDGNTFVGAFVGGTGDGGFQNTLLGMQAAIASGANLTNATAIGANAVVSQSNSLVLGNNANVGIGTSSPASKLTVVGLIESTTGGVKFPDGTIQTSAFGTTQAILNQTAQQTSANFNVDGMGTANVLNAVTQFNHNGSRILAETPLGGNLIVGKLAGNALTSGGENTFVGRFSGNLNSTGNSNSFFGSGSGSQNTIGGSNVFLGVNSGLSNNDGSDNTFVGRSSGSSNDIGDDNTYIGRSAGAANPSGIQNTYLGSSSGELAASGSNNTYLGYQAGRFLSGSSNTVIGRNAGQSTLTGTSVTLLGSSTTLGADNLAFATAIGAQASVSTSNTIVLGRSLGQDKVRIPGLGSAGATALCRNVNEEIATCSSSLRYKTNINPFDSGLDIVNRLTPITFDWKEGGMHDLGLGAEDVAEVSELLVIRDGEGQVEGVKYDRIAVVLLNVVKEQQAQIEELKKQVADLKTRVDDREGDQK